MGRLRKCSQSAIFNTFRNYLVKPQRTSVGRLAWPLGAALISLALAASAPAPSRPAFMPGFAAAAHTTLVSAKKSRIDLWGLRRA